MKYRGLFLFSAACIVLAASGCGDDDDSANLPLACPATPVRQSPAIFGAGGIAPDVAETCDTAGSDWVPCHQHMHCDQEHSGAGICGSAECEVHTVYRQRKDGGHTEPVEHLHEGTVGGNCVPADHDLMVVATFLSFDNQCAAGNVSNLTYCGSATGNNTLDTNDDGVVTCQEAGVNPTSVRWCIQTACECHRGSTPEEEVATFGEIEATKAQGCPS
jgi:hypothetical protein